MFMFGARSLGVGFTKVMVEEYEWRGEEVIELFTLADAGVLRRRAGMPHKWIAEEQHHILEQEQRNPGTE
jgi:hypothetical protein